MQQLAIQTLELTNPSPKGNGVQNVTSKQDQGFEEAYRNAQHQASSAAPEKRQKPAESSDNRNATKEHNAKSSVSSKSTTPKDDAKEVGGVARKLQDGEKSTVETEASVADKQSIATNEHSDEISIEIEDTTEQGLVDTLLAQRNLNKEAEKPVEDKKLAEQEPADGDSEGESTNNSDKSSNAVVITSEAADEAQLSATKNVTDSSLHAANQYQQQNTADQQGASKVDAEQRVLSLWQQIQGQLEENPDDQQLNAMAAQLTQAMQGMAKQIDGKQVNLSELSKLTQQIKQNLLAMTNGQAGDQSLTTEGVETEAADSFLLQQAFAGTDNKYQQQIAALLNKQSGESDKLISANGQQPFDKLNLITKSIFNEQSSTKSDLNDSLFNHAIKLSATEAQTVNQVETGSAISSISSIQSRVAQPLIQESSVPKTMANVSSPININKPEFQQQFSERVNIMMNAKVQVAEMRLDPPDLGSMQVRINLNNDQANVSIVVQSQQAKDALDQAIPRLRELLNQQGINLGESSVEKDSNGGQQPGESAEKSVLADSEVEQDETISHVSTRVVNGAVGGIDFYA